MNSIRLFSSFAVSFLLALGFAFASRAAETVNTLKFSQPDQPGTVKIHVPQGAINIEGSDSPEIVVKSGASAATHKPRQNGLRELTPSSSLSVAEKDNVVTIDATNTGPTSPNVRLHLTVPRQTSVIIQSTWGGNVTCRGVGGDVEISNMNGSIRLEDLSGGLAISTMNGQIQASMREVRPGKTLSLQSMNGEVVLRLPADAKANVRVRTQNGSVLTDFDEGVLVTKTETPSDGSGKRGAVVIGSHNVLTPEAREAIREAARVGAEAVREAAVAIREAADAARQGAEEARASTGRAPAPPAPPRAPRPPKPIIVPTITGGKLVTGTLNGGGPEINIATMNGDITLRRLEQK